MKPRLKPVHLTVEPTFLTTASLDFLTAYTWLHFLPLNFPRCISTRWNIKKQNRAHDKQQRWELRGTSSWRAPNGSHCTPCSHVQNGREGCMNKGSRQADMKQKSKERKKRLCCKTISNICKGLGGTKRFLQLLSIQGAIKGRFCYSQIHSKWRNLAQRLRDWPCVGPFRFTLLSTLLYLYVSQYDDKKSEWQKYLPTYFTRAKDMKLISIGRVCASWHWRKLKLILAFIN